MRTNVDLPDPFSPTSATISPSPTLRSTESSACTAPNCFEMELALTSTGLARSQLSSVRVLATCHGSATFQAFAYLGQCFRSHSLHSNSGRAMTVPTFPRASVKPHGDQLVDRARHVPAVTCCLLLWSPSILSAGLYSVRPRRALVSASLTDHRFSSIATPYCSRAALIEMSPSRTSAQTSSAGRSFGSP